MTTTTAAAAGAAKIRWLTSAVDMSRSYQRGDEVLWPLDDARRLASAGYVEFVASPPPPKSSAK